MYKPAVCVSSLRPSHTLRIRRSVNLAGPRKFQNVPVSRPDIFHQYSRRRGGEEWNETYTTGCLRNGPACSFNVFFAQVECGASYPTGRSEGNTTKTSLTQSRLVRDLAQQRYCSQSNYGSRPKLVLRGPIVFCKEQ